VQPAEPVVRVNLVGGSELSRDILGHVLMEAGIDVTKESSPFAVADVHVLVAEGVEPARLLAEHPNRRVVLVADLDPDDEAVVDLVVDGADAVVGPQATAQELSDAVRTVASGGAVLSPRPARRLAELARANRAASSPAGPLLTGREIDILLSIGRGESVKQTARTLGISAKTVENLQSRLFRKLEVRNRAQAFAEAHAMGLLPLPVPEDETLRVLST